MFTRKLDVIFETIRGGDGRSIIAMVGLNGLNFLLCNLYTPNLDNPEFFSIFNKIQNLNCEQRIIAGDFNQVLYTILDRKGGAIIQMKASKYINSFLNENEWVDLWRLLYEDMFQFTWHRTKPTVMSRLDYFLVPMHQIRTVVNCQIMPGFLSDHSFVEEVIRGRGFWKLNTSLLEDHDYVREVNKIIQHIPFRDEELSPSLRWEMLKQML